MPMCGDAHCQFRTRSLDRTATEPSVSLAAVDANIAKQMRAEFVTQRLLKFVTQWLLEFGTASLGEARRMASLTAHQGRDPATRAQVSLSQGWHELLGITCAISHSLANAAMIIFPGVARSQSRAIWKEPCPKSVKRTQARCHQGRVGATEEMAQIHPGGSDGPGSGGPGFSPGGNPGHEADGALVKLPAATGGLLGPAAGFRRQPPSIFGSSFVSATRPEACTRLACRLTVWFSCLRAVTGCCSDLRFDNAHPSAVRPHLERQRGCAGRPSAAANPTR